MLNVNGMGIIYFGEAELHSVKLAFFRESVEVSQTLGRNYSTK